MNKDQKMATSDWNLERLNSRDYAAHTDATIQLGGNIAVFGRRGSGKTQIAKQKIKESKYEEVYINLSVYERVDMGGYPDIMQANRQKQFVDFLLPGFYEKMLTGDQKVVALLDEVDKADPSLWAPLLEFTQFRSINGRKLPNLHAVIMTGNLISEGGSRPSLPLLDRAEKYLIEADVPSWLDWAGKSGKIHPSVVAYINDHTTDLFGNVDPEDRYADPSPRGWERASEILFMGEKMRWSSSILGQKVCGCVGKETGLKYSHYFDYYHALLPLVADIFKGEDIGDRFKRLEPSQQLVCSMIVCSRLSNQLDQVSAKKKEDNDPNKPAYAKSRELDFNISDSITHVGRFLQQVTQETTLVAIRSQIQIPRIIEHKMDDRQEWAELFAKIHKGMGGNE